MCTVGNEYIEMPVFVARIFRSKRRGFLNNNMGGRFGGFQRRGNNNNQGRRFGNR